MNLRAMRNARVNGRRICAVASIVIVLLMTVSGGASAQSLADIARQEEARRSAIVISSPVYTNADLHKTAREKVRTAVPAGEFEPLSLNATAAVTPVPASMHVAPAIATEPRRAPQPEAALIVSSDAPAAFTTGGSGASAAAAPAWATFMLPKSPEERAIERRQRENADPGFVRLPRPVLPPSRETLKTSVAVGYVQDSDWGTELTAMGSYWGLRTDARAFVTSGPAGLEWYNGWFALENPDTGWRLAAGDLANDLRGASRGVRMSWSGRGGRSPAVSLLLPNARLANSRPAVTYRDAVRVARGVTIGGEASTDGGAFIRTEYSQSRVAFETSFRRATGLYAGRDWGWTGAYDLWRGFSVRGGGQYSATTDGRGEGHTVGGRIPLPGRIALNVDHTVSHLNAASHAGQSATIQFSMGRVRFLQRYGRGTFTTLQAGRPATVERRQLQTTTAFTPVPWASLQFQVANQWQPDGRLLQWQELAASVSIGRRTQMQAVMALPRVLDPSRLRVRLSHTLSRDFRLELEYGRLGAFQSITRVDHEQARFRVMFRKSWDVATPAGGSLVKGRIADAVGEPVAGALVRLGPYRVATDETGAYAFPHVPRGAYQLSLDRSQLPTNYASAEPPRTIMTRRSSQSTENFLLMALDTVRGYVYEDKNSNGKPDEGEGMARLAIRLNDHVTATDQQGAYAFFNVAPGAYEISVVADRLPAGYALVSAGNHRVEVTTGRDTLPIEFRVKRVERPVIFQ